MLRAIAIFKFAKAALLIALSLGAFRLLHKDVGAEAEHLVNAMRLDPGNRFVDKALTRALDQHNADQTTGHGRIV